MTGAPCSKSPSAAGASESGRRRRPRALRLFDTHCHLNLEQLAEAPEHYWERARAAGVVQGVVVGIDAATSELAVDLARRLDGVHAAVGVHPTATARATERDLERIAQMAVEPGVVALGESGLDFYWPDSPPEVQARLLAWHVELALDRDLPLILHIRDAYGEAARQLASPAQRGLRAIVHCFAGEPEEVEPFVDWGWPISFSGILTYPKAENVRRAAKRVPLRQCLIETDAPWLKPRGAGGEKGLNEPAHVRWVAEELARIHGVSSEQLAEITTENALLAYRLS